MAKKKYYLINVKILSKKIFVVYLDNSWADTSIFLLWLEKIFLNNTIIYNHKNKILIRDLATTHYDENLKNLFKKINSHYILLPSGLTGFIQPSDISINALLTKNSSLEYGFFHRSSEMNIINAFVDILYNDNTITKDIIIKYFKVTGISSKIYGSEDNLIIYHEEICDEIISLLN